MSEQEGNPQSEEQPRRRWWWRLWTPSLPPAGRWRRTRWVLLRVLGYYLLIVGGIALFQRSLIYLPSRVERISAADAGAAASAVEDVSITTEDGLQLRGWYFPASDDAADKERWTVLFFHGNGGDRRGRVSDCESFARVGADVYLFDYRGYGDNPGSPSETALVEDAVRLWEWVREERNVSSERIVLYGESLGGGVATQLAAELSRRGRPPAGLILHGTFSSMTDAGAYHYPWIPVSWLLVDRYDSCGCIGSVNCPLLQFHGRFDEVVPFALGRRLFRAAPAKSESGVPKQFIELTRGGHNDISVSSFEEKIAAYFETLSVRESRDAPRGG